jgi:hypothetical protein
MATMNVLDAAGATVAVEKPLTPGRAAAASSRPVAVSTEDKAVLDSLATKLDSLITALTAANASLDDIETAVEDTTTPSLVKDSRSGEYETVAASQTDQALGATGATGDSLSHLIIVPATTSPGAVSIKDGAGSAITVFTGGASSVTNLVPFTIALDMVSLAGAWKVTTGANVSVIAVGNFT